MELIMRIKHCICAIIITLVSANIHAADIDRYVNDETLLVASANIEAGQGSALRNLLMLPSASPTDLQFAESLAGFDELLTGVTEASLILSTADLFDRSGPIVVLELAEATDAQALAKELRTIFNHVAPLEEVAKLKGQRLALVNNPTLRRIQRLAATPRPDLTEPLAKLRVNNSAAAVLSPGPDARRALRELWPGLPAPFAELTGPLVADGVRSITLAGTKERVELRVEAADVAVAEKLEELAGAFVKAALAEASEHTAGARAPAVVDKFVHIERTENVLAWPINLTELRADADIRRITAESAVRSKEAVSQNQRLNQMKQLALAMLNYQDGRKSFPAAAAICDADGNPLLSWRVALLPLLGEDDLFRQFKLDEPWDSEHNLPLVERIPEVYSNPTCPQNTLKGLTNYLLPVHEEAGFLPAASIEKTKDTLHGYEVWLGQGLSYKDIKDGTVATLLIVEAAPENAVPWTKPQDWEVDLEHPYAGVRHAGAQRFASAWMDGSARVTPTDFDEAEFRKIITRAGKEALDSEKWRNWRK